MGRRSHSRSRSRSNDKKRDKTNSSSNRDKEKERERKEKEIKKRSKFSDVPVNEQSQSSFGNRQSGGGNSSWSTQQNQPAQQEDGPTNIQSLIEIAQRNAQLNEAFGKVNSDKPPAVLDISAASLGIEMYGGLQIPGLSVNLNGLGASMAAKAVVPTQSIVRNIDIPQDNNFNYVGLILGPKGSNQKRIQEKTRCRIIIKSDQIPPHVQIAGSSEKDVADACCEIERILFSDEDTRNKIKSEQLREVADINNSVQQNRLVVKVPQNFVGLILGKGGETIRSIKTQCGASYIQMDSNQINNDDYKNFTVFGTNEQCEKAQKMIFDYIESYKSNSKKEIFEVPVDLVGGFIGKSGCNIQNINKSSGARLIMNNNNETVNGNKIFDIVGSQQQIQNAIHLAQNLLEQLKQTHQQGQGQGQYNNHQNNYHHNHNNHHHNHNNNHHNHSRDHYNNRDNGERGDRNYGRNNYQNRGGNSSERDREIEHDRSLRDNQELGQQQQHLQQQQQQQQQQQHQYYQQMQMQQQPQMAADQQQQQQLYQQQQMLMQQYYQQQMYYQQYYSQMNPQIEEVTIDQSKR